MSTFSYGTQPFVISFATTFTSVFIYFIIGIVFTITKEVLKIFLGYHLHTIKLALFSEKNL